MKTLKYLFIAIFLFFMFIMGIAGKPGTTRTLLIQSTDRDISTFSLSQSAAVITNRLKNFSQGKFEVTVLPSKKQIRVSLPNDQDLETAEKLVTQKGALELYETYSYKSITSLLNDGGSRLKSLIHRDDPRDSSANLGCTLPADMHKVSEYLDSVRLNQSCKFAWNNLFKNSEVCLYALKTDNGQGALLKSSDLEGFKLSSEGKSKQYFIDFKVKEPKKGLWADITKRNIDRSIAIVLDNHVIYAPVVRDVITGGNCQVSGDFTRSELSFIVAIGNSGELPSMFIIVK